MPWPTMAASIPNMSNVTMTQKLFQFPSRQKAAALALALLAFGAPSAHADATLDKIKQRGKVVIGVLVGGGPFGSIDPATQQPVGWNPELARAVAKGLGVEVELVQGQTPTRLQL